LRRQEAGATIAGRAAARSFPDEGRRPIHRTATARCTRARPRTGSRPTS